MAQPPLDELCDRVLERLITGRTDDDIALLAIRDARTEPANRAVIGQSRPTPG
ncbi:hypothetical protein ACU610_05745 [Geodermatophilus sp. URMC 61]|uniref:hypothetical protein n=1 Tax=Geodermatophilus sp. URMC 61 TaxID=3423411 RepID=UPI00406CD6DF